MDIASILPLDTERSDMQYQWLSRFLITHTIDNDEVMTPFIRQAAQIASNSGETLILCIDQPPISDRF
ncbi:MAG: transposase, partial [Candidatus Electrothrix sp. AUS1_2]|nr:transposase [Candidatus Electrothrix sp. AUS1_2]